MISESSLSLILLNLCLAVTLAQAQPARLPWLEAAKAELEVELVAQYGDNQRVNIQKGLPQVGQFWRQEDGDAAIFVNFVRTHYAGEPAVRDSLFHRFEYILEQIYGHMHEIGRELRTQVDLTVGPVYPFDELFAAYNVGAHVNEDFFANKLAFVVLLNFPLTTLQERLDMGAGWSRQQWAEARLAQQFSKRIPAEVNQAVAKAASESEQYISEYNIWMHHLLDDKGQRLFPAKLRLLSHWNLRDQLKADYAGGDKSLPRQKMIQQVMERIITQTIPEVIVDNPNADWNPYSNVVTPAAVRDGDMPEKAITQHREPDTRYAMLLKNFRAAQLVDAYSPTAPTQIDRSFAEGRELSEARVKAMLEQVVSSPLALKVGKLIAKRLGRPLQPFDIWYNGFRAKSLYSEIQLDEIVAKKYPTPAAFEKDIPRILCKMGFSQARAVAISEYIKVDPARGSGHAMGAGMRSAAARLRTRVDPSGMNYKGYNIAVHELGHNVEQVLTLNYMDHYLLNGVPNTAFTEAMAFVFQSHDLDLLELTSADPQAVALKALDDFWAVYEISGVALVEIAVWHWLYDHPEATAAELKEAVIQIAKNTWNRYYQPVFKQKDVILLAIYSHMIERNLYLPDYPLGHLIAQQIEEQLAQKGDIGPEMERMLKAGSIAPDLWMHRATGSPVAAEALLVATERALKEIAIK